MDERTLDRFWSKVKISDGCWEWTAATDHCGYGRFGIRGRNRLAHRVSFCIHVGPVPEGMCVLHRCDNPPCVNPDHLFLGTQKDNMRDRDSKRRTPSGESHAKSPLTWADVAEIRRRYAAGGCSLNALAREFGVTNQSISKIVLRKSWREE